MISSQIAKNMSLVTRSVLRPEIGSTAFFVCDIQERFREKISCMSAVIQVARLMKNAANLMNIPLIATEQYRKALGVTVVELELQKHPYLFEKFDFSMWTPEVKDLMNKEYAHIKTVAIVGIEAHVCVSQTVQDLLDAGYSVHVIADGVSSCRDFDRKIAIDRMRDLGAAITTVESFLFALMKTSKYEKFKDISNLLKEERIDPGWTHTKL